MTAARPRLTFGIDSEPVDPSLCVARVRSRWEDVLTETLCIHRRVLHGGGRCAGTVEWPGGETGPCPCEGFKAVERRA